MSERGRAGSAGRSTDGVEAFRPWQHDYNHHRRHRYPIELDCPLTHGPRTTRRLCLPIMTEAEHTIVIAGAGPTGLTLGAELKRLGISSLILDRLQAGANTSRAAVIHVRTSEGFEPLEVTSKLLRNGVIVPGTLWAACSAFVPAAVIANLAVEAIPHTVGIGFSPQLRYAVVTPVCALVCLLSAAVYPVLKRNARRPLLFLGAVLVALAFLVLILMATFGSIQLARNASIVLPCSALAIAFLTSRFVEHPVTRFLAVVLVVLTAVLIAGVALAIVGERSGPKSPESAVGDIPRSLFDVEHGFIVLSNGAKIHYVDVGSGPILLFLHGNPSWSFQWRDLIGGLRGSFRCVALDYPGFGFSSAPEGYGFTPREQTRIVEEFVDRLGLHDVTLVLQDWGGPIGIGIAEDRPELVRNIILGNTWAWPTKKSEPRGLWSVIAGGPIGEFLQINFNGVVYESFASSGVHPHPEQALSIYKRPLQPVDRRGIAVFYAREITIERDYFLGLDAGLSRLRSKPTLIFWGSKDPGFLGNDLERWEKVLPHHRTIILPNANHFFFEDAPQQVIDETRRFMTSETVNAD
jgi:pimeloyl-ACP methyl ester carboxylesterase